MDPVRSKKSQVSAGSQVSRISNGVDSLQDILGKKKFSPPNEIEAIKHYIKNKYRSVAQVKLSRGALIVSVPNSALAATLHLERQNIIDACKIKDKKLVIRTG